MNIFFAIVCEFGSVAIIILLSTLDLSSWLKAIVIVPVVLLAVYSMARIPPQEPKTEKNTNKSLVDEIFKKAHISDVLQRN
jgi:hypothetical protein